MSRLAKKPIAIPAKTEVAFVNGTLTVKGPLGTLSKEFRHHVKVTIANNEVQLTPSYDSLETKAMLGTYVAHLKNMLNGVNKPYEKKLIIEGIGYKADVKGKELILNVGFSHPVNMPIPADIKLTSEKGTITISGINRETVGQFAAEIRAKKKPEPYLGKGIRYSDEVIRRKQGKKAA